MLANHKIKQVEELLSDLSKEEIIWLNGYLAGLVSGKASNGTSAAQKTAVNKITITYGTETGNAQKLAGLFAAKAKQKGIVTKLVALDQYRFTDLQKEEWFFTVVSTQGEGEIPLGAKKFYDQLLQQKPSLSKMKYAVLALGDTSYPLFCKAGEDFDTTLESLGAKRLLPLVKCDVDYDTAAEAWFNNILDLLNNEEGTALPKSAPVAETKSKGKKYYQGKVLTNINLNGRGSDKETYHIEIATAETVDYEAGDSLAIVPQNRKYVVDEIIRLTGIERTTIIETEKQKGTVEELLTQHLNICYLLTSTVKKYGEITGQQIPDTRMDLKDILRIYPVKDIEQFIEIVKILKPIAPRLYSISSSPLAHEGEMHLTVSKHQFLAEDQQQYGLCSEFLGELPAGAEISFYIHKNRAFKLPEDSKDIIMIGPGTGIAPFRAFVAERDAKGAKGRNWLFFGDRQFTCDFLYQTEWQAWVSTGTLTRMNVAFSRDQKEKVYVQHKLLQHGSELYQWLENGAHIYLCGAKTPMSVDVENALLQLIKEHKHCTEEEAAMYLNELKKQGRYSKDVY